MKEEIRKNDIKNYLMKKKINDYNLIEEELKVEEPQYNIFYEVENWVEKKFSNPDATIRIATMFSGIGSIEHALKRLNLKEEIISALNSDFIEFFNDEIFKLLIKKD
ncbi:hypothetical protein [Flavobacterium branchiophilum]|uniref:DNA (cytosine-5-)-methyltransferase n=1 Tax=Flavobacterium branchiophilum TaxID=55197 RepID=A0A2H3KEL0_9FLAO|nr:hypothetical protein [Flavobacterium branchiophilum]PDS26729.1 hypothetical protein B0A77_01725 [Flavobacterium branchiophilum]